LSIETIYLKNTLFLFQGALVYVVEIPAPILHRNYWKIIQLFKWK